MCAVHACEICLLPYGVDERLDLRREGKAKERPGEKTRGRPAITANAAQA